VPRVGAEVTLADPRLRADQEDGTVGGVVGLDAHVDVVLESPECRRHHGVQRAVRRVLLDDPPARELGDRLLDAPEELGRPYVLVVPGTQLGERGALDRLRDVRVQVRPDPLRGTRRLRPQEAVLDHPRREQPREHDGHEHHEADQRPHAVTARRARGSAA